MARAVLGLVFGFTLVFGVALWARNCLPNPNEEDIDWLRREDVVVAQVKTVDHASQLDQRINMPEFTLYGDGTVITDGQRTPLMGGPAGPLAGQLSSDEIQSILEHADDSGFYDLSYELRPASNGDPSTTFVYVKSLQKANSIRTSNLLADDQQSDEHRTAQQIIERLISADWEDGPQPYPFDAVLFVARRTSPAPGSQPFDLPDEIDVSEPDESGVVTTTVTGGAMRELIQNLQPGTEAVAEDERGAFVVAYRPLLPHEENFPEFDPPVP